MFKLPLSVACYNVHGSVPRRSLLQWNKLHNLPISHPILLQMFISFRVCLMRLGKIWAFRKEGCLWMSCKNIFEWDEPSLLELSLWLLNLQQDRSLQIMFFCQWFKKIRWKNIKMHMPERFLLMRKIKMLQLHLKLWKLLFSSELRCLCIEIYSFKQQWETRVQALSFWLFDLWWAG